jgi:vacuolar-type H+-ATPase subunit I/STV1
MLYITRNDEWLGYGALICAASVALLSWLTRQEVLAAIFLICLEPLGLYLAVRGMLFGRWLGRICAGVAFLVLVWSVISFFAVAGAHAKIHT